MVVPIPISYPPMWKQTSELVRTDVQIEIESTGYASLLRINTA